MLTTTYHLISGHGGPGASEYTHTHLIPHVVAELEADSAKKPVGECLVAGFATTEAEIMRIEEETDEDSGTCACAVVLAGLELTTAHVGDCRAIIAAGVTPQVST